MVINGFSTWNIRRKTKEATRRDKTNELIDGSLGRICPLTNACVLFCIERNRIINLGRPCIINKIKNVCVCFFTLPWWYPHAAITRIIVLIGVSPMFLTMPRMHNVIWCSQKVKRGKNSDFVRVYRLQRVEAMHFIRHINLCSIHRFNLPESLRYIFQLPKWSRSNRSTKTTTTRRTK